MPDDDLEQTMPLGHHLDELRARLIVSIAGVVVAFLVCWVLKDVLMSFVVRPHAAAMRALGLPVSLRLIRYQEGFYSYLKVSLLAALVLASPLVVWQTWAFVRSGLRTEESALAKRYGFVSFGLFLAGAAFGFFVLIPLGLRFLAAVGMGVAQPMISMSEYVSLVTMLTLVTALVFELPLVIRFLVKLGVVEAEVLAKHRRVAILAAVVCAAVLTPPDPFTQTLLAVPMVGLYELGLVAADPTFKRGLRLMGAVALVAAVGAGIGVRARWVSQRAARVAETGAAVPERARVEAAGRRLDLTLRGGAEVSLRDGSAARIEGGDSLFVERGAAFVRHGDSRRQTRVATGDVECLVQDADAHVLVDERGTEVASARGVVRCYVGDTERLVTAGRRRRFSLGGEPADVEAIVSWTEPEPEGETP